MAESGRADPRRALPAWIGLVLFAIYLLTFSGHFHVMDELAVFTAGDCCSRHAHMDINQRTGASAIPAH